MRLFELIDFVPKKTTQPLDKYQQKVRNVAGGKHLGHGSFGTAYDTQSNKRLNQVTKVGKAGDINDRTRNIKKVDEDGYLAYLKAVYDSNSSNPYFPRIDDLKIMTDPKTKGLTYRANIEKLVPFMSPKIYENEDLMASLYDDMFMKETFYFNDYGPAAGIKFNLDYMSTNGEYSNIKDPELREALEFITKVQSQGKRKFTMDLHSGNIMWRITGNRPQLVIMDPLA